MQNQSSSQYIDLITSGLGYMKRLRFVNPNRSKGQHFKPFMAVSICAVTGESGSGSTKYVTYDLNIKGAQAIAAMEVLKPYLIAEDGSPLNHKVLVNFRIGDAIPEVYFVNKDGKEEPRVSMKGRLLKLLSAKVNGSPVELPKTEHDLAQEAASSAGDQSD